MEEAALRLVMERRQQRAASVSQHLANAATNMLSNPGWSYNTEALSLLSIKPMLHLVVLLLYRQTCSCATQHTHSGVQ